MAVLGTAAEALPLQTRHTIGACPMDCCEHLQLRPTEATGADQAAANAAP